jgi:hypothetical protein
MHHPEAFSKLSVSSSGAGRGDRLQPVVRASAQRTLGSPL